MKKDNDYEVIDNFFFGSKIIELVIKMLRRIINETKK